MNAYPFDDEQFSPSEYEAIQVHKYYLSEKAGCDVGWDCAVEDWLNFHAARWRGDRLKKELEEQSLEIEKHKWIESEKAGCDLGNKAALDWVIKYAADWRHRRHGCHRFINNQ